MLLVQLLNLLLLALAGGNVAQYLHGNVPLDNVLQLNVAVLLINELVGDLLLVHVNQLILQLVLL